ncbi:MAG: sigma 54-interacting transcriptional regulator, partial [Syntrophomonadaceae bacterium]|nr:sigma 54-interacting transcriptional regulator [Syntrophomonadaceae bacterium]
MKVEDIMIKDPILLRPDYSISKVARIFEEHKIGGAPVVDDNGLLIGVFTKRHFYKFINMESSKNTPIAKLMRINDVVYGHLHSDISQIFNYSNVGVLPIVDSNHKVVGIITRDNLFQYLWKTSTELNSDLRYLLQFSFDGLSIVDGDGTILYRNSVMKKLTGVPDEEAIGRSVHELRKKGAYGTSNYISSIKVCQQTKKPVTVTYINYEGRRVVDTCSPVLEADGSIKRIICNIRDVTEFNLLQEELQEAHDLNKKYKITLQEQYKKRTKTIYSSPKMQDLMDYISRIALVDSTVLITGESGTGKELVAENIHYSSTRKDYPLIKVNCSSIPESLFESEMFGYESGAFTGAKKTGKLGYFDLAENGSIFLDEIGDLPYSFQVKLLRVIQNKEYIRVGGNKYQKANVRILAATNKDLLQMVRQNR